MVIRLRRSRYKSYLSPSSNQREQRTILGSLLSTRNEGGVRKDITNIAYFGMHTLIL